MEEIWERIETWLEANAPTVYKTLGDGATISEIEELEAVIGVTLPNDVRFSYLRHNGQQTISQAEHPEIYEELKQKAIRFAPEFYETMQQQLINNGITKKVPDFYLTDDMKIGDYLMEHSEDYSKYRQILQGLHRPLFIGDIFEWLSLQGIRRPWSMSHMLHKDEMLTETDNVDEKVRPYFSYDKWIPIFCGTHGCLSIDYDPTPKGKMKQLIFVQRNWYARKVYASSFREYLEQFAKDLEAGLYVETILGVELIANLD